MDVIERDDLMYCEIYSCKMSISTCVKRQQNAIDYKNGMRGGIVGKPGALDVNCQNCSQGALIMEQHKSREIKSPAEILLKEICTASNININMLTDPSADKTKLKRLRIHLSQALADKKVNHSDIAKLINVPRGSLWIYLTPDKYKKEKKVKKEPEKKVMEIFPSPEGPPGSTCAFSDKETILKIDFTNHMDTLREIEKASKRLMRDPDKQVLFWLVNADFEKLTEKTE